MKESQAAAGDGVNGAPGMVAMRDAQMSRLIGRMTLLSCSPNNTDATTLTAWALIDVRGSDLA